jgi:hypothetical protein
MNLALLLMIGKSSFKVRMRSSLASSLVKSMQGRRSPFLAMVSFYEGISLSLSIHLISSFTEQT